MQPASAHPAPAHDSLETSRIEHWTGLVALFGGLMALAVAALVTVSVFMRWAFSAPIDGDFEFVKMATAVAVFAYLPYTQARRGNIIVDTFTAWLPATVTRVFDALWDTIYAVLMGYFTYALVYGTLDAIKSGETTMQRQLLIWPSIAVSTVLCAVLAVTAILTALRLIRMRRHRRGRA
jgi:TRAP-type C4-dicarboxylate transport system permease small subunit